MGDTAIVGDTVEVIQTGAAGQSAFSWNVAVAGALAAIAVSFILYSLGSGIGLTLVSPYSDNNPSAGTMTAIGAVWLIVTQSLAFATAGYLAGRLRVRSHLPGAETKFRDAAHGFMAWAIGVILAALIAAVAGMFAGGAATLLTGAIAGNAAGNPAIAERTSYYVDTLFRADPSRQMTTAPAQQIDRAGKSQHAGDG